SEPVKLAYVSPSYQDPTGVAMSLERRKALLRWATRTGAVIIEDAWDSDYVYSQAALPPLKSLDQQDRVIYLYSFWKVLYPLTTIQCAVMPPWLVPVFDRVKFLTERQFPVLEHHALAEFIREGTLERHIRKTKTTYEKRRAAVKQALTE